MSAAINDIEFVLLVGAWVALNLSLMQDWISRMSEKAGVSR
jgi:hypothetical protein